MFLTKREPSFFTPTFGTPEPGFRGLRREMDRLFDDWMTGFTPAESEMEFMPAIDVKENGKKLMVKAELPGMEQKDVEVELDDDCLVLRGKKEEEKSEKGDNWYRHERRFGSFERMIPLPWNLADQPAEAEAVFKNGVLTVEVAKPKGARPRTKKLEVKVA